MEAQESAGIDFTHVDGGSGRKYMVESLGHGGGFFDYDNDGDLDVYLVQSGPLPGYPDQTPLPNRLYRNDGGGTFTDVTAVSGAGDTGHGMGCCFGDVDNDGFVDIYVTNFGPDRLYHNNGNGTFTDVTTKAGLGDPRWSTSAAFADYDRDGFLDLYVATYLDYSIEKNVRCGGTDSFDFCGPDAYDGVPDVLYHNNGDGTFADVTKRAGVLIDDPKESKGLGVIWLDYDDDGDEDIYVSNDGTANFLFRNAGDGTFTNVAVQAGCAYNERGMTEAGMGVDAGDVDNDGDMDILVVHLNNETNTLFRNLGNGAFRDDTAASGVGPPSLPLVGFGTGFLDFDNDGDLDAFVTNGHIRADRSRRDAPSPYAQPPLLYENDGKGKFADASQRSGAFFKTMWIGRGAAFGDVDNDGDVDILLTNWGQRTVLLRNEVGSQKHWITLDLKSRHGGRPAVGARVKVFAGDLVQTAEVRAGSSYMCQNDTRLHFGLADRTAVDRVEIRWPEGDVSEVPPGRLALDRIVTIQQ